MGWRDSKIIKSIVKWSEGSPAGRVAEIRKGEASGNRGLPPQVQSSNGLGDALKIESGLMERYRDYEEMDDYPEISAALDIYADDATIEDAMHGVSVWVESENKIVRQILMNLLHRTLRVEDDIHGMARGIARYGNGFWETIVDVDGVIGLTIMPPPTMRRVESEQGILVGFIQDDTGVANVDAGVVKDILDNKAESPDGLRVFAAWEVAHARLRSKDVRSMYGYSVIDSARWAWRRLVMLEDAALVYKLTRAPARFAFYIDTGDLNPAQAMAYVQSVKAQYRKKKVVDSSGRLNFRVNPLAPDEDYWIPVRAGKETSRIEVISGPDYGSMEGLDYFRSKVLAAIKMPRSYMGLEGESNRSALAQEDVRFARAVMRLQRAVMTGIEHVCRVHLAALGIDPDLVDWQLKMTSPSSIFRLAQIEVMVAQADLADRLGDYMPKEWILQTVFGFSKEDSTKVAQTKGDEQRMIALRDASVQSEVLKKYPELAGVMMDPNADGGDQGANEHALPPRDDLTPMVEELCTRVRSMDRRMKSMENESRKGIRFLQETARNRRAA